MAATKQTRKRSMARPGGAESSFDGASDTHLMALALIALIMRLYPGHEGAA